jgi:DNA-binding NtrC family response regulator
MPGDSSQPNTTILGVDDEDGIRQALERFLTRLGYTVRQAPGGAEALAMLSDAKPTAMLSDIRMPGMTGVELVPKVIAADPDVAIIMLTAIDEPRTAIDCLKLGAFDYLIKPVDLEELELSLQAALRARQLEVDRRNLEQWLAREVAVRTREIEDRTALVESVALDAIAAAKGWTGADPAIQRLAAELGVPEAEIRAEVNKRRG